MFVEGVGDATSRGGEAAPPRPLLRFRLPCAFRPKYLGVADASPPSVAPFPSISSSSSQAGDLLSPRGKRGPRISFPPFLSTGGQALPDCPRSEPSRPLGRMVLHMGPPRRVRDVTSLIPILVGSPWLTPLPRALSLRGGPHRDGAPVSPGRALHVCFRGSVRLRACPGDCAPHGLPHKIEVRAPKGPPQGCDPQGTTLRKKSRPMAKRLPEGWCSTGLPSG